MLTCAVLVGLAGSTKWTGFVVGMPACIAIVILRHVPWYTLAAFSVVPLVHLGIWMIGLKLIGHSTDPWSVWEEIQRRNSLHLGFQHSANPLESAWYTQLFVMCDPIAQERVLRTARLASSVDHPLLWVVADGLLFTLPVMGATWVLRFRNWRERWRQLYFRPTVVDDLEANISGATQQLGWDPRVTVEELVEVMVDADYRAINLEPPGEGAWLLAAMTLGGLFALAVPLLLFVPHRRRIAVATLVPLLAVFCWACTYPQRTSHRYLGLECRAGKARSAAQSLLGG